MHKWFPKMTTRTKNWFGSKQHLPMNQARGYKSFSYSTQLSTKFQLLIKTKILKIKTFLAFKLSGVVFIMLINVKMPTIVGILTLMSRINFVLSWVEHGKSLITLGPGLRLVIQGYMALLLTSLDEINVILILIKLKSSI